MQIQTNTSLLEQKQHGTFTFPFLISYESIAAYDSGEFTLHWHPEIELTLVTNGEMLYKINNSTVHLKEGDVLFCNAGALHSGQMYNRNNCEYTSITFDSKLIYGYENSLLYEKYVKPIVQNFGLPFMHICPCEEPDNNIVNEIQHIVTLYNSPVSTYEMDIIISLQKIWKELYNRLENSIPVADINSTNLARCRTIISYINLNYSQKITLDDIAKQVHLCESECCRMFKNVMNISLFRYIQEYRIKKATELLIETNYSVSQISEMVGFNVVNHFSKTFHQYMSVSPRTYRQSKKQ